MAEPDAIARTRWLEVLRLEASGTGGRIGPKTRGGLMVVKLGMLLAFESFFSRIIEVMEMGGQVREVRLLLLNKVPSSLLSKGFTGTISKRWIDVCFFFGNGVPVLFAISMAWVVTLGGIYNSGK